MSLADEDAEVLAALIDSNGYTAVLDAMADIAETDLEHWHAEGGPKHAVRAIVHDLRRTLRALERAAIDVRG
jgi:hypothetical protein